MKSINQIIISFCLVILISAAHGQIRNGFDLSESIVPPEKIKRGNVPRDGIPSIDNPKFVNAENADFLRDRDRVLGVFRNDIAKAYPTKILDHHEIVNDSFGEEAIVVSYCPLCYTGMVFSVQADGFNFTFGVSGLIYNSDVLLYDRQTRSLWSQILSKAISGPLKGVSLPAVPASHTTWRDWSTRYPATLVLSTDTGFRRDYRQSPYVDYARTSRLTFPVENRSKEYRNKDLVLGISANGVTKAYPFKELEKNSQERFEDSIGSKLFTVEWFESENFARILDDSGQELPSIIAYWFAWYAFHPDTEVFRAGEQD
jgi:hypothetical protein